MISSSYQTGCPLTDGGAEPDVQQEEATRIEHSPGEGWAVILFNDEDHDMMYVVVLIVRATGFEGESAWEIMMTAHTRGTAVVTITSRSEAERIASVLKTGGLIVETRAMG